MDDVIFSAPELWNEISKTAQFQQETYDLNMLKDIRSRLALPPTGSMPTLLKKHHISCEELLDAVLSCMQPFADMLNDLYAMFQKAGAQQSNHNLRIQFDFNKSKNSFSWDLDFFRQQAETSGKCLVAIYAKVPAQPFALSNKIREIGYPEWLNTTEHLYPEDVQKWLKEYRACPKGVWPGWIPDPPSCDDPELNKHIQALWNILQVAHRKCLQDYSPQYQPQGEDAALWWAEVDRWMQSYISAICDLLLLVQGQIAHRQAPSANAAAQTIKDIVAEVSMSEVTVEVWRQAVMDILNLPFWKKRYELYSVWICTQIVDALSQNDVTYHVTDNTLSFSFSGSHIATLNAYHPPLELWAEVRTHYACPDDRPRKNHIQPDYTLAIGDAYKADHSVAVVECKQYKKYSRKNFLNAAEDYAGGRPNASVFLTNYGPIPSTLKDSAKEEFRDRIQFCEFVRPGTKGTVVFRHELKEAIDRYYDLNYPAQLPAYPLPEGDCSIRLRWGELPADLDLHMVITSDEEIFRVGYNQKGGKCVAPFAVHGKDDTEGHGNETIQITKMLPGEYDIYVHDYHETGKLSSPITLLIEVNGIVRYAISRTEPIAPQTVWHPYRISDGMVIPVNDTVEFEPQLS